MTTKKIVTSSLLTICLATSGLLATVGCSNKQSQEALAAGQRAGDVVAIENVMSLHFWYHAAMMNDVEVDKLWAQHTDGVTWAQNSGYWKGLALIKKNYGQHVNREDTKGQLALHPQSTPVIEIAADRKTAKGIWYTAGIIGGAMNGKLNGTWMWERYGVDFVNEDGQWKIWHMHIYTDFGVPVGGSFSSGGPGGPGGAPGGAPGKAEKVGKESAGGPGGKDAKGGGAGAGMAPGSTRDPFNPQQTTYKEWGADSKTLLVPRPPEPYKTFSETFSYADENEWAKANAEK
jgi:hypothetical protein